MAARAIVLAILLLAVTSPAQDILTSYPKAVARTAAPPAADSLSIVCQKKLDDTFVSLLAAGDKRPILVAFTRTKLSDPARRISFNPLLLFPKSGPAMKPGYGDVKDWAYIFDRNGDGQVDYMAFVIGPYPMERDNPPPADYPKDGKQLKREHLHWAIDNMGIIFLHMASDNFDGEIDAIATEEWAANTVQWADHKVLLRLAPDGKIQAWRFKNDITQPLAPPAPPADRAAVRSPGLHNAEVSAADFKNISTLMKLVNRAAAECKLAKGAIPAD